MAFNNYLEDENDKPYFTTNSLAYYYDKMEGFAKAVEGSAKALNLTKEEVEKRITLYIEQNKNELDQRLAQWDGKIETFDSSIENLLTEWVDDGTLTNLIDSTLIDQKIGPLALQLAETEQQVNDVVRTSLKPFFIEYFASFNKFGLGTPSGITNYTGGNYVLQVTGNSGDSFLTVVSGNISHAGGKWACVIKNDDGLYHMNKVMSHDGVNKITLYAPLKKSISNGILANLHDAPLGQHYTEHGYFAFAQHLYNSVPRYSERNSVLSQFLPSDQGGKWVSNSGSIAYNSSSNMTDTDELFIAIGSKYLNVYMSDTAKYVEWEEDLNGYKGYLETFVGSSTGVSKVEFFLDDILMETKTVSNPVERLLFPFEYAKKGKIRISVVSGAPYGMRIGRTSWFVNEKFSKTDLISPDDKVVFIGDSWGEYHNKATTRELRRLMIADGGTPTVLDFSKGGHTSDYARAWFTEYVIKNKPNKVIIEYFTNDFNSMSGASLPTFTNPDGQQQEMNIANLREYEANIKWMIDKAIEYGIQPIVIMPASVNSTTQAQNAANYNNQLWNGIKTTNDTPYFQVATLGKAITNDIEANGTNNLVIKGKAVNSANRKGVVVDSDTNLTGGSIQRWSNNGVDKAGVRHDGTIEMKGPKLIPQSFPSTNDENSRATITLVNGAFTDNNDELRVVLKLADGTYVQKKIQLID